MEQFQLELNKFMDWIEMMNIFVGKGYVCCVVIYDLNGKCLVVSEDLNIFQEEIILIV